MLNDLKIATVFLTRLPVRVEGPLAMRDLAGAVHLFPLVGALVGLIGAAAYGLGHGLGLPALSCAVLALAATALATGALHEDGLADTADGLGAGSDRARALEIMRDSRIGSFGAVALVLTLLARASALTELGGQPGLVAGALVAAGAASRAAMPVVMRLQPSARASGLAAEAGRPEPAQVAGAVLIALGLAFLLLPTPVAAAAALGSAVVATVAAAALGRRFGGCTGDTLSAVQQLTEAAFLFGVVARL